MRSFPIGTAILFALVLAVSLATTSCTDKSVDDTRPYDHLIGDWPAKFIDGAVDAEGTPLDSVTGAMSTLTLNDDKSYSWYLHAPPYFDLSGEGHYVTGGDMYYEDRYGGYFYLDGVIPKYLGTSIIRFTATGDTLTLVDDDGDRWTYIR